MIAQYYRSSKTISVFDDKGKFIFQINKPDMKLFGFPPFSRWDRTVWGYELKFSFDERLNVKGKKK